MNLGISAWRLAGQPLGIGRYIEYLLRHWVTMLLPEDRVNLFVREPLDTRAFGLSEQFSCHVIQPGLKNALWENLLLPRHTAGIDVLFGPSYTLPLLYRGKSVVAIHSVDEVNPGQFPWWYRFTYEQKYRMSANRADRVIVNSHDVKRRVHERYGVPAEKIDVIWLGADDSFHPERDQDVLRKTRTRYLGEDVPFILFMGGLSQRRNVPLLMTAFSVLKHEDKIPHRLLLMGPNRANLPLNQMASDLGIESSVVHTEGEVARHGELIPVYSAADLYVLPSESEGFSLTLVEALACGVPAITVNRSALGEIAHGHALTIEKPSVEALVEAMRRVLRDPALKSELIRKGLDRARELRWSRTAQLTLELLRKVGGENN